MCKENESNWIKLNRGIRDNFIWDFNKPKYTLAWIDMLLMANYKDKKAVFDGKVEVVERGSFVTSMVKLSERWGMDRKTVKRFLDGLRSDEMIDYFCTNKRTTIKVLNYGLYQGFSDDDGTAERTAKGTTNRTAERTAKGTQRKKVKNRKEIKNNIYTDSTELNEALTAFMEHRKKIKKPMTEHAVKLTISKLNKMTADVSEQIQILNQSIENGWQGVFPLKTDEKVQSKPKSKFNNAPERNYDMKDLERQMLGLGG